jgi:putative ABC transport system ATP-binding protein
MVHGANTEQLDEFLSLFDDDSKSAIEAIESHTEKKPCDVITVPSNATGRHITGKVIVSVDSLTKSYKIGKKTVNALNDVTLEVREGEFVALTGSSGSGKSTLLQLIGGLDSPTSGAVSVSEVNINRLSDAKRSAFRNQTIGFVFQFFYLQPFLTIAKNIEVPGMFAHVSRKVRRAHADELLEKVGLHEQETHLPKQLSGGQIQRAAIARALLNNPKILLADEPTGNLDSVNSKMIVDLFRRIRDELGTTIIIVTHNSEIALQADREIRLRDGVII